jgi:hypothetical protein
LRHQKIINLLCNRRERERERKGFYFSFANVLEMVEKKKEKTDDDDYVQVDEILSLRFLKHLLK